MKSRDSDLSSRGLAVLSAVPVNALPEIQRGCASEGHGVDGASLYTLRQKPPHPLFDRRRFPSPGPSNDADMSSRVVRGAVLGSLSGLDVRVS